MTQIHREIQNTEEEFDMPNGKAHVIAGTVCGAVVSLTVQNKLHENKEIDLGHLLLSSGAGAAVGRLPDILEPATHPNHRAFFHSFAFGVTLGAGAINVWRTIEDKREERKAAGVQQVTLVEILLGLLLIAIIVFLLHLLMDGFTKKGLPII